MASLSPKRPRQDWRDSGVSAAMWELLDPVCPRSPTGRANPPTGPGRPGGTQVYPPLCGSGYTLSYLVLPQGIQSPKRPRQGRRDSGVSAAMWDWLDPMHTSFFYAPSLSPKRPTQDRRDWGVCIIHGSTPLKGSPQSL